MPAIRKGYVVFVGFACVCILYTGFWSGLTKYSHIHAYQRWFAVKLCYTSNNATGTAQDNRTADVTRCNVTDESSSVSQQQLNNKTLEVNNNVTLYVTSHNIWHGRLGNQMFKYAAILGISRRQGRRMFIEHDTDLQKTFKLKYVLTNESVDKWSVIKEDSPVAFDAKMMNLSQQHTRIDGFLQSFVYFKDVFDEVRQEFTFRDSIANEAAKILREVYLKYNVSTTVGVHVRRGDFLSDYGRYWGYGVPEKAYFMKAFNFFKSKFPDRNITFVIASDDLAWCRDNLRGDNIFVLPDVSAAVHLAVLSSCDHAIISGGTYGWWSGWMANGYVVYYTGYMGKETRLGNMLTISTYYPRLWIGFGN